MDSVASRGVYVYVHISDCLERERERVLHQSRHEDKRGGQMVPYSPMFHLFLPSSSMFDFLCPSPTFLKVSAF